MEDRKDGGAAFPSTQDVGSYKFFKEGMSLRDYFAGQALTGIMAGKYYTALDARDKTFIAYTLADEMLKARDEERSL